MANDYPNYVRVAANVSDTFYLDEVKAVAFSTQMTSEDDVKVFVNNNINSGNVFDMINLDTFVVVTPEQNLLNANVVAFVTRDSNGNSIAQGTPYYTYIVSKNRGGYQKVQETIVQSL